MRKSCACLYTGENDSKKICPFGAWNQNTNLYLCYNGTLPH
jgi:hypothetical protein